ncbi:MAG: hypothetical protein GC151_13790 [Betaproteobacteria bacterium]|nr:hypothetical protein [Betaproteobacteria bacterium]
MTETSATYTIGEPGEWGSVVERLRLTLALRSEAAVARELGFASPAWANRKKSGSLPWDRIIALCLERGISVDYLLTGRESETQHSAAEAVTIDESLLEDVLVAVEAELTRRKVTLPADRRARVVAWLYGEYKKGARQDERAFRAFMDLLCP